MTRRLKTLVALGLPALLLAGALSLQRTSAPRGGAGAGEEAPVDELRRSARLEDDRRFLLWENAAKLHVAREVIRRRLGLREGAAVLRAIDARRPARLRVSLPDRYPGRSDGERYCRSMLVWVRGDLGLSGGDPARIPELEAELAESLDPPGPLRLPDVALDDCLPAALLPVPEVDHEPRR